MGKKIFIFSAILALVAVSLPQSALGLATNVTVSIDNITSPERGISISPSVATPTTGIEMSLNAYTGACNAVGSPRVVVIKNGNSINGSSIDVSGGLDVNKNYRALNIVNGANLAYKSGFSNSVPLSSNAPYYVNFTKQANLSFNYTTTDSPTYNLYLEMCATCSTTGNAFPNPDCTSVATPASGWTNCGMGMHAYKYATPPYWTAADCNTTISTNKSYVLLGAVHNTYGYNQFYIFLQKVAP